MDTKTHWTQIYETKAPDQVSWYQATPELSLHLIKAAGISKTSAIIDVGGGTSTLVDQLLAGGFEQVSVLDISPSALVVAKARLGRYADAVNWIEADITHVELPEQFYDLWHDRAVFHFLTHEEDRRRYVANVRRTVKVGGHVIVATFAPDGPEKCSGLDVMRYSPDSLHSEFGSDFTLLESRRETHPTPFGTEQKFIYCYCRLGVAEL